MGATEQIMNILICDDVRTEVDRLKKLLLDSDMDVHIAAFESGYDVLEYVHTGAVVDLCFFDIVMPELSGVELAAQLRADGFTGQVVFLTTSNDYAAESYQVNAFSYLLKPPRPDAVRGVLQRLDSAKKAGDNGGILVKVSKVSRMILFREIACLEVIGHYVYFRLAHGEDIQLYATFGEFAPQLLCDRRFAQCHRSYIVNLSEIAVVDERELTMRNEKKIPISKSYADVKRKFTKWILEGAGP